MKMKQYSSVEEYVADFPKPTQKLIEQLRATIKKAAPKAEEVISYGMPGYKLNGMLVWFGAYAKHIGFYPKPAALREFAKELSEYKMSKGTVQFPLDKPLPLAIITKIVKFRISENSKL